MTRPTPLDAERTYHRCPPEQLEFDTTEELEELELPCGQDRLLRALEFGAGMRSAGFNLFVLGPEGSDRHDLVRRFLARRAASEAVPPDWCHVFNFDRPERPHAIRLPAGEGRQLRDDLENLVEEMRTSIPAAFESDEYQGRLRELQEEMSERQNEGVREVQEEANKHDIELVSTPSGFTFAPVRDGEVLDPEEYEKLPEEERERIEQKAEELQKQLQQAIQQVPRLRKELREKVHSLNEEMVQLTLGDPIHDLKEKWAHLPRVAEQLDAIHGHVVEHAEIFRGGHDEHGGQDEQSGQDHAPPEAMLARFRANLLVDHAETEGAPVIYEDLPNHQHLTGQIEHHVHNGALYTDFSLIRAGALHHASGGYLILDARRVLMQPMAWDSLKRVLFSGEIRIESLERLYGLVSTVSLEPEPVPASPKVVLVGDRLLYYLLSHYDPDFAELFKVEADFEDDLERDEAGYALYARMLASMARRDELRPLDRGAVARTIEHASRLAGDQTKLTAHDRTLRDLLMEADHWARQAEAGTIGAAHIERAIEERIERSARVQRRSLEQIRRGTVMIATEGRQTAQVNGLSVMQLGSHLFGRPMRITATARPGKGQVIDIEREARLGGPIHSKSVMILSRFLASRYTGDAELSLSASLAFEQSYGGIEGDSASVAEICSLLSAIARIPLKQALAVTGSVNQHGEVQAVGGVNEKIEGFFDVCREAGEMNGHGVLIPASNVEHLMLRRDVREAVAAGHFRVYPLRTVDDAIGLLTEMSPGEADADGEFPAESFNRAVADRLATFARLARHRRHDDAGAEDAGPVPRAEDDD